jgi:hypothetical protein
MMDCRAASCLSRLDSCGASAASAAHVGGDRQASDGAADRPDADCPGRWAGWLHACSRASAPAHLLLQLPHRMLEPIQLAFVALQLALRGGQRARLGNARANAQCAAACTCIPYAGRPPHLEGAQSAVGCPSIRFCSGRLINRGGLQRARGQGGLAVKCLACPRCLGAAVADAVASTLFTCRLCDQRPTRAAGSLQRRDGTHPAPSSHQGLGSLRHGAQHAQGLHCCRGHA